MESQEEEIRLSHTVSAGPSNLDSGGHGYMVSVVMPVYNAEAWVEEAIESIMHQSWQNSLELSIYDDASTDSTPKIIKKCKDSLMQQGINVVCDQNTSGQPGGVGFAKNRAIYQSTGKYLCFMDADDVMYPRRIELQLEIAKNNPDAIVGCCFERLPLESTQRYTEWANSLSPKQLLTQVYTSFGPTVIQPTWFCNRQVFQTSGPFDEIAKGFPEDLTFFYRHLSQGGRVLRVNDVLLMYRYHLSAASFSVHEDTIWEIRVKALESNILAKWEDFAIWNAGKQGRKLYRSLSPCNRAKVRCFCDVDEKKIRKGYYRYENAVGDEPKRMVPVIHFSDVKPPVIICMKLGLTGGVFEENLKTLSFVEGRDFYHFN